MDPAPPPAPPDADRPASPAGGPRAWATCTAAACAALVLLHGARLLDPTSLVDEQVYRDAFDAVDGGRALTTVPLWYYPDVGAVAGAAARRALGGDTFFLALRAFNLLGVALTIGWAAAEQAGARAAVRRSLVVAALAALPAVSAACEAGNVSGVLLLLLLAALATTGLVRVALLTTTFALKPYGLVLAVTRRTRLAAMPLIAVAAAWLDTSNRGGLGNLDTIRNNALVRSLHELGLPVPWEVVTVAVLLLAAWRRPRGPAALAWGWLALPIAWEHTSLLVVPALGAAAARPPAPAGDRRLGLVLAVLVGVIVANAGLFGSDEAPRVVSGLLGLAPTAAVLYLIWAT